METLPTIKSITDMAEVVQAAKDNLSSSPEKASAIELLENIATAINELTVNLENNMPLNGSIPVPGRERTTDSMQNRLRPGPRHRQIEENLLRLSIIMRRSGTDPQAAMGVRREMRSLRHLRMLNNQYFELAEDARQHNLSVLKSAADSFTNVANLIKKS
jgi:hypothetical protein